MSSEEQRVHKARGNIPSFSFIIPYLPSPQHALQKYHLPQFTSLESFSEHNKSENLKPGGHDHNHHRLKLITNFFEVTKILIGTNRGLFLQSVRVTVMDILR